ncbi:MAG: hypothetical protein V3T17_17175 [Pseudomonadales bacterium]
MPNNQQELKNKTVKKPPRQAIKSVQYDLFSQFIANDQSKISNTVEIWESIPKYFFTPKQVAKLRTEDGLSKPYKWEYLYNNLPCSVKIQPALVEMGDGSYKAFFPSITEELVEEALKKIFTDQQYGIHDPKNYKSWIRFTLGMLQKELKARGRSRNRKEIKHAIEVMSSCVITLRKEGKEIWKGSILQDLVTVGRDKYLADTDAQHIARLPLFISHSINRLEYRQFNYDRLMSCNEQLTRWIYKQLIHRFRQASLTTDYHVMYSGLIHSGLLQQATDRKNRQKISSALDELVKQSVLQSYKEDPRKVGRKIIDVKYTLFPAPDFTTEQKAANKRAKDNHLLAIDLGLLT